jgi:hypothetical protein
MARIKTGARAGWAETQLMSNPTEACLLGAASSYVH